MSLLYETHGLPIAGTMSLRLPFGIYTEYLVRELFLLIRHHVIKVLKGRNELLYVLCVLLGDLFIGLHVLHRVH